ncbi:MAG TPA: CCA tRNA nucleotidyltransferase [Acidobacteriaceae bacterium]|nr:CCA tRNA nucleotidyltransferase [Acidobacteriaceae bacterium]
MADYIYLLESRLSQAQQSALLAVREIARSKGLTVFLVGGAVRDLTSGSPVRDLDVVVQGNALKLQKLIEKAGATIAGENEAGQSLFVSFPGGVRMEIGSTLSVQYPKPGKPVVKAANLLDDLRRRDFTANAMALSLNEGSYGLLMDPLNGVADIENRELRLVSNYGFIEDPVRMIRAARYAARLGWAMEEKTKARYDTGKSEGYISAMSSFQRGYELEELAHEEDPLRVIRGLEQEGWMKVLTQTWTSSKANVAELEKLREAQAQLQMRGVVADASAAQFPLLTAKMAPKDVSALKKSFTRQGFVKEIDALEGEGKKFAAEFSAKPAATPSVAWKMLLGARPEAVLWAAYSTSKNGGIQARFKGFYTDWPQARQRIPYTQMQEMRIVPGLAGYDELVEKIFFELMDGKLGTPEEMKAFLEPYSPPAPPPPVHLRRARLTKKEPKVPKARKKAVAEAAAAEDGVPVDGPVTSGVAAEAPSKSAAQKVKGENNPAAAVKLPAPRKNSVAAKESVAAAKTTSNVVPAKKAVAAKVPVVKARSLKAPAKKAIPAKKAVAKSSEKKAVGKKPIAKAPVRKVARPAAKKVVAKAKPNAKGGAKASVSAAKKPVSKVAAKPVKKPGKKIAAKTAKKKH